MRAAYTIAPRSAAAAIAVAADGRRRCPLLPAAGRIRPAGAARPRLQELGQDARLHLLRRQLRNARLRLPAVPRAERRLRQRRAALPDHQRDGHADRRPRRRPRRVLLQHRRRLVRQQRLQVLGAQRRTGQPRGGLPDRPPERGLGPRLRRPGAHQRVPPAGWARLVRHRPRDLRPRLPDPLRLVVADAVQPGVGGRRVRGPAGATPSGSRASRSGSVTTSNAGA